MSGRWTKSLALLLLAIAMLADNRPAAQTPPAAKPARLNRAIDLLERGQPVYYTTARGGYEEGKKLAQTASDYITYEMEHGAFDMAALREFMRGLVDGGPTKSGHRTPAVIATLPILGLDEAGMRANHWVVHQVLAAGVHGILLCHAREPEAARAMVEAARYPFAPKVEGLAQGLRGSGSQTYAAEIWGIPANEYLRKADPWPLNAEGEILLGVKIEDSYALTNAEKTTKVPGIAFAEWGPGDMSFWLVGRPQGGDNGYPPVMLQARARVLKATKDAKIFFLNSCNDSNVAEMLKDGVMICTGGYAVGRKITKRTMPW
jgi:4-hydroxy-2-oxoheptanedioate aldolase